MEQAVYADVGEQEELAGDLIRGGRRETVEQHEASLSSAVSASVLADEQQACYESGMDEFLAKPISVEELHSVLVQFLARPFVSLESETTRV
ncbi:MAG: hypothetical protein JST93_33035 [Acidobacteria bacterium]|nr:hypothetical protein [Acidobacteriota bacterium]